MRMSTRWPKSELALGDYSKREEAAQAANVGVAA